MPEETKKEESKKPEFKSVKQFDFKGINASVPVLTQQIDKGKAAGNIFLSPDWDTITFDTYGKLFDPSILVDEIIAPELRAFCYQASAIAEKKSANNDGSIDMGKYATIFSEILAKLTLSRESLRSLQGMMQTFMFEFTDIAQFFDPLTTEGNKSVSLVVNDKSVTMTQDEINQRFVYLKTNLQQLKGEINALKEQKAAKVTTAEVPVVANK